MTLPAQHLNHRAVAVWGEGVGRSSPGREVGERGYIRRVSWKAISPDWPRLTHEMDSAHTKRPGRTAEADLVVNEHGRLRGHPKTIQGELEDPRVRLQETDLTRQHELVHQGVEAEMEEHPPGVITAVADQRARRASSAQAVQELNRILEDPGMSDQETLVLGDQLADTALTRLDAASQKDTSHRLRPGPCTGHHALDNLSESGPEHVQRHAHGVRQVFVHPLEVDAKHSPVDVNQPGLGRVHTQHDRTQGRPNRSQSFTGGQDPPEGTSWLIL